jgi:putative molybdopterin biosynthesis protein
MIDLDALRRASRQDQFLDVISPDDATARFQSALRLAPLGLDTVALASCLGRVLAADVVAPVDAPGFDRASVDGFALRAADLAGAAPATPVRLRINPEILTPGCQPRLAVTPGTATPIATGGMVPRGADAVVMVEHTEAGEDADGLIVAVSRGVAAGAAIAAAGSDITSGETLLRAGTPLGSREIGMLAAVGVAEVAVWRRPRVVIFSTGDEIVPPGAVIRPGQVFDSNAATLAAAVTELGAVAVPLGIVPDDEAALQRRLDEALACADMVLLSGGTSKGSGDLAARVVARLENPGVVVHGVALKPGKPLCLAVTDGKPVAVLPGFPTSAIMTFHTFLAPVIRRFAGRDADRAETVAARLPLRIASERGRLEYVLVSLSRAEDGSLVAFPAGKGSGAVTAFAQSDGFFAVPPLTESVAADTIVSVQLIGTRREPADLTIIGSHCVGLDLLVGFLAREGLTARLLAVGSQGGLAAARRGECDIAPVHLMDPVSLRYNTPFLSDGLALVPGYTRMQGLVFRRDDARFGGSVESARAAILGDASLVMMNRNAGSGTRVLIDGLLAGVRPNGYSAQAKSHNGVAAAVAQGRADWGMAIATVASRYGLGFLAVQEEQYDFIIPSSRAGRAPVRRFCALLTDPAVREALGAIGFTATRQEA